MLGNAARILLVVDLEHNRDLVRMILTNAGHEVDTAENGVAAIAAVQAKIYDLVLMDVQMPVMDGVVATKRIRELYHPASNVPIIAMTGNVLGEQVKAFAEAGMSDHLGKPFRKAELLQKVETWLGKDSPGGPADRYLANAAPKGEFQPAPGTDGRGVGREWPSRNSGSKSRRSSERPPPSSTVNSSPAALTRSSRTRDYSGSVDLSRLCSELEEAYTNGQELRLALQTRQRGCSHCRHSGERDSGHHHSELIRSAGVLRPHFEVRGRRGEGPRRGGSLLSRLDRSTLYPGACEKEDHRGQPECLQVRDAAAADRHDPRLGQALG